MRIAVVSTMNGSPWGGSEELWAAMVRAARAEGHPVAVSVLRWPTTPPRIAELAAEGAVVFRRRHPPGRWLARVARQLTEPDPLAPLVGFAPDVVCINQGGTYDIVREPEVFAFVKLLQERSIPYVVLCHLDHEYRLPNRDEATRTDAVWSRAARVGFVAQRSVELAERQLARRVPNAVIVRNPVNLIAPVLLPWPSGDVVRFASVARLDAVAKGLDVLLETLATARWRERSWRLHLYGEGPDRDFLQALVAFYELGSRIELRGHVTDVARIWADHHLLLLSSRAEGAPLALVEAMLCGRPAVATDVGGICEWIEDGETGFVAAAATRRALDAALESAWHARARWPEMGRRAHEVALDRSDATPGLTLLALLREAVGGATRAPARAAAGPDGPAS